MDGLIRDLALILLLGAGATLLFKWLKQPVVLGYIVAGFLASPHFAYLPSVTSEQNIEFWAQIGIIALLFCLGLEFSFKKLLNAGGSAVVTALFIICGMMGTGYCVGYWLGFSHLNSLFLGGMLSMSSTTIILKALTDLGLRHKKFASLVLAVLIVEDLFAVLLMVVLSSIATSSSVQGEEMIYSMSRLGFFLIIWFAVGVFLIPSLLNWLRNYLNSETLLVVSMGLCLGMAVFSVQCGFSLALGAFVMGSILAGTSFAERIEHVTLGVKDLFGAVFFISVGMMVNPEVIATYIGPILLLSVVVIIGMIFFGTVGMLLTGQKLRVAIESGFSLTQIGEFSFIIATLGMNLGVLQPTLYPIIVAVSVITTFTTPYFIRMSSPACALIERHLPQRLRFLIDRYSESAQAESGTRTLWKAVLKRYLWRLVLYSIVLTALVLISVHVVLPWALAILPEWGRFLTTIATLAVMSPFLVALALPASQKEERKSLLGTYARFDVPLIIMSVIKLIVAMGFVIALLSWLYSLAAGWGAAFALLLIVGLTFSKSVRERTSRIESRFLDNLNERELRRSGRNNNLVSNIHLAYVTVGPDCPFVGERLKNSGLRSKYGVSVSSILRGDKLTLVPDAQTRIFPGDVLGIIGTDEEIQALLPIVEGKPKVQTPPDLSNVKFTSVQLSHKSPIVNHRVADASLGEDYGAMLVAVQRGEDFEHPAPDLVFSSGDILWAVGDVEKLKALR